MGSDTDRGRGKGRPGVGDYAVYRYGNLVEAGDSWSEQKIPQKWRDNLAQVMVDAAKLPPLVPREPVQVDLFAFVTTEVPEED